jgi:hypothetical protein
MKCLKCGRELPVGVFTVEEVREMHTMAHRGEDLRNALEKLEAREKRATDPTVAMAYAEAIAMIRVAMEPIKFQEDLNEQAKLEVAKSSYEHGNETEM